MHPPGIWGSPLTHQMGTAAEPCSSPSPSPKASARSQGCHRWKGSADGREVGHSPALQMGTMLRERTGGKNKPQPSPPWGSLGRSVSIFPPFPSLTSSAHPRKGQALVALSPQKQEIMLGKGKRSSGVGGRALPRRPPGCHRPRVFPPRPCTSCRCLTQGKPQHPWKSRGSSGCCRGWEGKSKRGGSPRGWNICVAAFRPGVTRVSARNKTSPERGAAVSPQLMNGPKNRFPVYPATNRFWGRGHLLAIFCQAPAQLAPRPAGLWPAPSCPLRCCSIHVRQEKGPAEAAEGWRSRAETRSQPCHQHRAITEHGCRVKPCKKTVGHERQGGTEPAPAPGTERPPGAGGPSRAG